ncbi:Aste57867_23154 [Aphanomyces stellatus]|uniref:Aste57867_23154 protein n=1 Tax=Aphanomyces stellatus TaxID=120398 RepID=A0A485LM03_9STRA|nr:hypothetical protein As57867_023083 [Aphanomyces stellatus]VFT99802.1 Aste57867_23154 [Aphanomyces stellatus]
MGNCMSTKYTKASHTDDDSITRDKPIVVTSGYSGSTDGGGGGFDSPPNRVADAIRDLPADVDLKTLSSLAAANHHRGPSSSGGGIALLDDLPGVPPVKLNVRVASAGSMSHGDISLIPRSTSQASLKDITATSHDTIRKADDNVELLRQIQQAMHDESARNSSPPPSIGGDAASRKTSSSSGGYEPSVCSDGHHHASSIVQHPPVEDPAMSPPQPSSFYMLDKSGHLHRMEQDGGHIPVLGDGGGRGSVDDYPHMKPSFTLSSPRSSCPVIDHTISPTSNGDRSSRSFSMSPRSVRPTALSLESLGRFTTASGERFTYGSHSFSYPERDTRSSVGSDAGFYL